MLAQVRDSEVWIRVRGSEVRVIGPVARDRDSETFVRGLEALVRGFQGLTPAWTCKGLA